MVKIKPYITIDMGREGQSITLEIEEAKELYNTLAGFLNNGNKGYDGGIISSGNGRKRGRHHHGATTATNTITTTNTTATKNGRRSRKRRGREPSTATKTSPSLPSMSETKTKEILDHIHKHLSDTKPRTLTDLLKGVSYIPNNIPLIRQALERQLNNIVAKKKIGKRTYYLRKQQS